MKKLEIEGLNNEASHNEDARDEQEENIIFSSKLVKYLSLQVKAFKEKKNDTLTANQLKKVYCHAAREGGDIGVEDINLYALARIHMFLRLKIGDKMTTKSDNLAPTKATKLDVEYLRKPVKLSDFIDISESWTPAESDFEKAQKEIEENDLGHQYENVSDLYLEYAPIELKWD